ncbi:MAG: asparaginase domain-containing protein [Rhodospirillaceae bacterium]
MLLLKRQTRALCFGLLAGLAAAAVAAPGIAAQKAAPAKAAPMPPPPPNLPAVAIGPQHDPAKPNIVVIDAGGTLTSHARDRISYLHYAGGAGSTVHVDKILSDLYPELGAVANLSVVTMDSPNLGSGAASTHAAGYRASRIIDAQLAKPDVDGVVITAGTNVLEEYAYFFDLTVQSDKPVVVTGAMHQYGTFTYDAYTNLFSSVRLAASGKTTCFGTVVLLNDQFFAARNVTKTDGFRMDTFEDRHYGALGIVNEDHIRPIRAPARVMRCGTEAWKTPFDLSRIAPEQLAHAEIAMSYTEASPGAIAGLIAAGAKGIVTSGSGPGAISTVQSEEQKKDIAKGILFVQTTRTGGEGYYDDGTPGLIGGGDLLPQKARILLQLGMTFSSDPEQIRKWFNTIGAAEFDMSAARKRGQAG